jgi:hypothetical protein
LYYINLLDESGNAKETFEDVFAEDLEMLDSLIETGEMNMEEYTDRVNNTYYAIY